jgi:metal-sulfur cluster biosynthetic enzyme
MPTDTELTRRVWDELAQVPDPEIPMVTVVDLGIVHSVEATDAAIRVELLPTFVGCPAIEIMRSAVAERLAPLADRVEVQVSYAIGRARPTSVAVETFGTAALPEEDLLALIGRHFDLRPAAIIDRLRLRRPIYRPTAAYGHFGRDDLDAPWEQTDKVDALREDARLSAVR